MKLKKIINHLDYLNDIILIDAKTHKILWHGEVTDIQAASDSKKDRQKYIKCLKIDKEFNRVKKVKSAKQFLDYKIDSKDLEKGITFSSIFKKDGKEKPIFIIYLKEK